MPYNAHIGRTKHLLSSYRLAAAPLITHLLCQFTLSAKCWIINDLLDILGFSNKGFLLM